ncbi:MAG: hypothetical protein AAGG00_17310 [Cyanobacteria bacterium P01_H01_bin.150]
MTKKIPELISAQWGFARDPILNSLTQFREQPLVSELMNAVEGAKVICANYDLLFHDFRQQLVELTGTTHLHDNPDVRNMVDCWLVKQAAYISKPQSAQEITNTKIPIKKEERIVYRPPRYGRAAVMCSEEKGQEPVILDVKGCGVPPDEEPVLPNSNGLLTLEEAIDELIFERLVYSAFVHAETRVRPIPTYAIVDLGFEATFHSHRPDGRATLLVRKAQTRPKFQWGQADPGSMVAHRLLEIESTLRRYGISASNCGAVRFKLFEKDGVLKVTRDDEELKFNNAELERIKANTNFNGQEIIIDGVNVQVSSSLLENPQNPRILDFGRYRLRSSFSASLYSWWERNYLSLRGEILHPGEADYVQPDPVLSMARMQHHPLKTAIKEAIAGYERGKLDQTTLTSAINEFVLEATAPLR